MRKDGIVAMIPVKGDSERVPKKNIRPFADTTLIELKIKQTKESGAFDEIVVSSEDGKILELASKMGVSIHERDPKYSTSDVPMSDVYSYLAESVQWSDIAWVNVTNPLIGEDAYQEAVKQYRSMPSEKDSLISVCELKEYVFHNEKPVNFEPYPWPRSQDLKGLAIPTFAISILKTTDLIERGTLIGENPFFFFMDPLDSTDIDYMHDFWLCELIYQKRKSGEL